MALMDQRFINRLGAKLPAASKSIDFSFGNRHYIILLSFLLCVVSYWGLQKDIIGTYHDDGIYVVTAKSLSEGTGYRIISLPGSPPQTKYPILYSYILSWAWSVSPVFPGNIALLKSVNIIFLFFIFITAYRFYCTAVAEGEIDGYVYAALVGANPGIFSFAEFAVSDLLFALVVILTCWLYGSRDSAWFQGWKAGILGLICVIALLTRSAGIPLAVAGAIHFLWMRRFRELAIYGITLVLAIMPWIGWRVGNAVSVSPSSLLAYYLQYDVHNTAFYLMFSDPIKSGEMLWANCRYLLDSLDMIWLLPVFPQLRLKMFVLSLLAVGAYCSIGKHSVFLTAFFGFYLLLILGWPFSPFRYVLPIIPLLLLFVFRGIHALENTIRRIWRGAEKLPLSVLVRVPAYLIVCLNIAWLVSTVQPSNDRWVRGAFGQRLDYSWSGFLETFEWIRANTHKGDVLATAYDPMYYLYTGRRAIMPTYHKPETYFYPYAGADPDVGAVEEIKGEFRLHDVRYLITNPLDQLREGKAVEKVIAALLASYSTRPQLAFVSRDGRHRVYKIRQAG
jgi:hypothetical protein